MTQGPGRPALARLARRLFVAPVAFALLAALPSVAGAAQLEQPSSAAPHVVELDSGSHPKPFDIVVAGLPAGAQAYVEQCDGVNPSTPNWDPTIDCDPGSSPAPVLVGADGKAEFAATDANHRFTPFVGESPQGQFTCLAAGHGNGEPGGAVPSYKTCQVRVSTNNAAITADQVLFEIALPANATPPPATAPPSTKPGASSTTVAGATGKTGKAGKAGKDPSRSGTGRASTSSTTSPGGADAAGRAARAKNVSVSGGSDSGVGKLAWLIGIIVVGSGLAGFFISFRRARALKG